jgi:hypothetical protein
MPRAEREINMVVGLREFLAQRARAKVGRLENADTDMYDFSTVLTWQRKRLADLEAGRDVVVYRSEIPKAVQRPRDGTMVFMLRGDKRIPAEYGHAWPVAELG